MEKNTRLNVLAGVIPHVMWGFTRVCFITKFMLLLSRWTYSGTPMARLDKLVSSCALKFVLMFVTPIFYSWSFGGFFLGGWFQYQSFSKSWGRVKNKKSLVLISSLTFCICTSKLEYLPSLEEKSRSWTIIILTFHFFVRDPFEIVLIIIQT